MSKVVEFPNKEQINEQASVWIARLDRGLSDAEQRALGAWVRQSSEHRRVLFEMAALWDRMDSLARLADLFDAPKPARTRTYIYFSVAASVVISALVFAWSWMYLAQHQPLEGIYETAIGEHSHVNLPDGSQLVLNTNSRVAVSYTTAHRLFVLERGEINIEVAHDAERPLSVMAGDRVVQAVGTAFNVKMFSEREVELLVTDGKVLVAKRTSPASSVTPPPVRLTETAMAVKKGEKIVLGSSEEKIARVDEVEIAAQLSWRQGNLVFRGESLEQALAEITRYTSVEFEVIDEHIKQERIAGLFKAGDVDGLLATLTRNFNIESERLNDHKILLRAR